MDEKREAGERDRGGKVEAKRGRSCQRERAKKGLVN